MGVSESLTIDNLQHWSQHQRRQNPQNHENCNQKDSNMFVGNSKYIKKSSEVTCLPENGRNKVDEWQNDSGGEMVKVWSFSNEVAANVFYSNIKSQIKQQKAYMLQIYNVHIQYITSSKLWKVIASLEYPQQSIKQELIARRQAYQYYKDYQIWLILQAITRCIHLFHPQHLNANTICKHVFRNQSNYKIINPNLSFYPDTRTSKFYAFSLEQQIAMLLVELCLFEKVVKITNTVLKRIQFIYKNQEITEIIRKLYSKEIYFDNKQIFTKQNTIFKPRMETHLKFQSTQENRFTFQLPKEQKITKKERFHSLGSKNDSKRQSFQENIKIEQMRTQNQKCFGKSSWNAQQKDTKRRSSQFIKHRNMNEQKANEIRQTSIQQKIKTSLKDNLSQQHHMFPTKKMKFKKRKKEEKKQKMQVNEEKNYLEEKDQVDQFSPILKKRYSNLAEMGNQNFAESFADSEQSYLNSPRNKVSEELFLDGRNESSMEEQFEKINKKESISMILSNEFNVGLRNSTITELQEDDEIDSENTVETCALNIGELVCLAFQGGSRYEGYIKNGLKDGVGKFFFSDGGYYNGSWQDDMMHGYGKLYYSSGNLAYEGNWVKGQFSGKGMIINEDAQPLNTSYDFHNFDQVGMKWRSFQGEFLHDQKDGKGTLILSNGEYLTACWKANKVNGKGEFHATDGNIICGSWINNLLQEIHPQ